MNARHVFTAVVICISIVLLSSPDISAQEPIIVKMSAKFSIISMDMFPILACEEAQHLTGPGGNLGSTKAIADGITLAKRVDYQSTSLRKIMWDGIMDPKVQVHFELFNSENSTVSPLLDLWLYDVTIPEISMTATEGAKAVEEVKMRFLRACWRSYIPSQGQVTPYTKCWNFELNKAFNPPPQP